MTTVLLVEDNEMNRDMLSRRLGRKGFDVMLACDGEEGVVLATRHLPDLILLDMSLPKKDGWTVARELRANAATAHLKIIALTAHALRGDRDKAIDAGCDEYDTKPVDFPRLLDKMKQLMG